MSGFSAGVVESWGEPPSLSFSTEGSGVVGWICVETRWLREVLRAPRVRELEPTRGAPQSYTAPGQIAIAS